MAVTAEIEGKRLLVVDDDASILKLLKTLLSRAKYRVAGCESGAEALKLLSMGQYDLIITDAIMPEMSGFDLVRAIRGNASFDQLPIVMLTRKNARDDVKKALEAGVTDYVLKPVDEHLLIDKVEVLLRNGQPDNRLRELAIHGEQSSASVLLDVRITSLRETGAIVRFPYDLPQNAPLRLSTPIFEQIGIQPPLVRRASCELKPFKDFPYEAEVSFVGMSESELKKIRAWLQKQEIQRKK